VTDAKEALRVLLAESVDSASERAQSAFDRVAMGRPIVLIGAGNLGRKCLAALRKNGVEPLAFTDNSPAKQGLAVDGLPVLSPAQAAAQYRDRAAFVVTICSPGHRFARTRAQFAALGCSAIMHAMPLCWKFPEEALPHLHFDTPDRILRNAEAIWQAFDLLADTRSRSEFVAHMEYRLHARVEALPEPSPEDQYFPADLVSVMDHEAFVDVGCYDGDTLRKFLEISEGRFRSYHGFEPDPANMAKAQLYAQSLPESVRARIKFYPVAVGAASGTLRFDASGQASAAASEAGSLEVPCVTLDETCSDAKPTFLKLDVEGAEQDALAGARGILQETGPVVAVCVYHRPEDIWHIPALLRAMRPDYQFHLRSHEEALELVLYAIPLERQVRR
jgi:FkbM family methyltransferase